MQAAPCTRLPFFHGDDPLHARRIWQAPRRSQFIVGVLLLLGFAARLRQYLAATSFWHDEAYLLLNIFNKSFADLVGPLTHEQAAPPLFLWALRSCYVTLGSSELAMRLPALVASLAALALMVPLARVVCGGAYWLWALGCACVSSCLLHLTYQVKPYSTDVLMAEAVLLAGALCLSPAASARARSVSRLAIVAAAVLGPWLSFPSVFVLGGACVALIATAIENRRRDDYLLAAIMPATLLASSLLVWLAAARHHNTPYQQSFWAAEFMDLSSPAAAVTWLLTKLVEAGGYGVQGIGIPMALLAAIGLASCWRRRPALSILLTMPACLACLASALHLYPLGNRLLAFLLPGLWLCAAQGLETAAGHFHNRAPRLVPAIAVLLLLAGGLRTALYSVVAKPSVEFRQAFDYVHAHWNEGDSLWVSQPEVYEAYFGHARNVIHAKSPREAVQAAALRGRVWMVCHPPASQTTRWDPARREFADVGAVEVDRRRFVHMDLSVFAPPPLTASHSNPRSSSCRTWAD
ncbi:MAG TPA: hypothetical protein VMV10_10485 [Pirellulales bacterium]|nr:hypothetical protein [Pirellulales bacterium]HVA51184.1 hypothetical protein [Pirellulales bacterium]